MHAHGIVWLSSTAARQLSYAIGPFAVPSPSAQDPKFERPPASSTSGMLLRLAGYALQPP